MSEPGQDHNRRHSDVLIIEMVQKFSDFIERYDRDVGALNEWRKNIDDKVAMSSRTLNHIAPAYHRGMWIGGAIVLAAIGFVIKALLERLTWN